MKNNFLLLTSLLFLLAFAMPRQGYAFEVDHMNASVTSDGNGGYYVQLVADILNPSGAASGVLIFEFDKAIYETTITNGQNHVSHVFHFPEGTLRNGTRYGKVTVCPINENCKKLGCYIVVGP